MKQTMVRLGGFSALVGVTVLLTLLFSILGNITCAIVTGLIFGVGKRWQWLALPCSLVFPGVLLLLSLSSKVELPGQKLASVALLSGGAFWAVLGVAFAFRFAERRAEGTPAEAPVDGAASPPPVAAPVFDLKTLCGNWTCEEAGNGFVQSRTLQIVEGKFQLVERTRRGRERIVARGEVSSGAARPDQIVFTPAPPGETPPPPAR